MKPWHYGFDGATRSVILPPGHRSSQQVEHVQHWWDVFVAKVQPRLSTECTGISAHLASLNIAPEAADPVSGLGAECDEAIVGPTAISKRRQWEAGQIDYMGGDSFESIQKRLDEKMSGSGK